MSETVKYLVNLNYNVLMFNLMLYLFKLYGSIWNNFVKEKKNMKTLMRNVVHQNTISDPYYPVTQKLKKKNAVITLEGIFRKSLEKRFTNILNSIVRNMEHKKKERSLIL